MSVLGFSSPPVIYNLLAWASLIVCTCAQLGRYYSLSGWARRAAPRPLLLAIIGLAKGGGVLRPARTTPGRFLGPITCVVVARLSCPQDVESLPWQDNTSKPNRRGEGESIGGSFGPQVGAPETSFSLPLLKRKQSYRRVLPRFF